MARDTCEVWANDQWAEITIEQALGADKDRKKRCPECLGQVRAHKGTAKGAQAHFEHMKAHSGCSRTPRFSGVRSPHPLPLPPPTEEEDDDFLNMTGAAGEHYVMSQLLRRGYIAALAPAGVPNTDIVVTDALGDRLCSIQVKARRDIGSDRGWHMKRKHESIVGTMLFYCFVDFGRGFADPTRCWLLPSAVVAEVLTEQHRLWLATPGKKGQPHKEGEFRRFLPDYDKPGLASGCGAGWLDPYAEAWEQIGKVA